MLITSTLWRGAFKPPTQGWMLAATGDSFLCWARQLEVGVRATVGNSSDTSGWQWGDVLPHKTTVFQLHSHSTPFNLMNHFFFFKLRILLSDFLINMMTKERNRATLVSITAHTSIQWTAFKLINTANTLHWSCLQGLVITQRWSDWQISAFNYFKINW